MLNATPDCIKVISTDGMLLQMNRAGCLALNVPEDSPFGMPWLSLLPESVRTPGERAIEMAARGHASRFPGMSTSDAGTIYWDNLLMPLRDSAGDVAAVLCVSRDVTEKTLLEQELESALRREQLTAREMHHRVKNVLSVVLGLVSFSEREAAAGGVLDTATQILRSKLGALSRASDAVFLDKASGEVEATSVDLGAVIRSVLQPYAGQCSLMGDVTSIPRDMVTTYALLLHEFATNAIKYGALSVADGHVAVAWRGAGADMELCWTERGGPGIACAPERYGFGTEMVDRVVQAVRGRIQRTWDPGGLVVSLTFPQPAKR